MIKLVQLLKEIGVSEEFLDAIEPHKSGEWVSIEKEPIKTRIKNDSSSRDNIFDLINHAYIKHVGEKHFGIKSPNDVLEPPYDFWQAIDIDGRPDADAVIFGKKTRGGVKISGIGHDGEIISKSLLLRHHVDLLKTPGFWIEASDPVATILIHKGSPVITDYVIIQKLFPDTHFIEKFPDGSYVRSLPKRPNGRTNREYLLGKPTI